MNLLELLTHAQAHGEDAILYLFQKFKSLILKYAYILEYEDAKSELELFFLELILKMPLKNFGGKDSNFRILAYIKQSMQRHYIYLSKQKSNYQIHNLFLEELPTKEHSDSTESIIVIREFVQHQSPINRKIILYRYLGYSNAEIGNRFHLSRQSINRHIQKIKVDFINWQKQN